MIKKLHAKVGDYLRIEDGVLSNGKPNIIEGTVEGVYPYIILVRTPFGTKRCVRRIIPHTKEEADEIARQNDASYRIMREGVDKVYTERVKQNEEIMKVISEIRKVRGIAEPDTKTDVA